MNISQKKVSWHHPVIYLEPSSQDFCNIKFTLSFQSRTLMAVSWIAQSISNMDDKHSNLGPKCVVPKWHSLLKPGHMMIPTHYLQTFTACVTSLEDGPSCTTAQRLRLKTHSGVGDCITLMSNYLKLQKNNTDRRIGIIGSSGWEIPIFKHGFFKTHLSMPERIAQSTQIL